MADPLPGCGIPYGQVAGAVSDWLRVFCSVGKGPTGIITLFFSCFWIIFWIKSGNDFFKPEKIAEYSTKQKQIVTNVIPHLQQNGVFVYITCSVFKKENEEVADFIKEKFNLQLIKKDLLKGYDKKADTMFVALFKK